MSADWQPAQYERFKAERSRPFFELLERVAERRVLSGTRRAIDLGCGTGELTRALHRRLGCTETRGGDSSASMLERCAAFAEPGLTFGPVDIAGFADRDAWDLVFTNAALQWVDGSRAELYGRLAAALRPGGTLAVQVPANANYATHTIATQLAREEPFHAALRGYVRTWPVLAPEEYAALLHRLGLQDQYVALRVYPHILPSRQAVLEWVKGTALNAYRARLDESLFAEFLARYTERLFAALPDERPFFYPFRRILLVARRRRS